MVNTDGIKPTLRELAANSSNDPWACPRCGCKDWRIVNSHERGTVRKRQRTCRHCLYDLPTQEVPVPEGYRIDIVPNK